MKPTVGKPISRIGPSWHGEEVRLMRDRLEADSNPECRVIPRSSALGVILEADANLITASALFDSIKPRVCGLTSKQWAFSFSLLNAAAFLFSGPFRKGGASPTSEPPLLGRGVPLLHPRGVLLTLGEA